MSEPKYTYPYATSPGATTWGWKPCDEPDPTRAPPPSRAVPVTSMAPTASEVLFRRIMFTAPPESTAVPAATMVTAPESPAGNDTTLRSPNPTTYGDASGAAGAT